MRLPWVPAVAAALFALIAPASVSAPTFNLTFIPGTTVQQQTAFGVATNFWTSAFSDNTVINLTVGTGTLGSGVLASTDSADGTYTYGNFRTAMVADRTSANDAAAVSHLPNTSSIPIYINYTADDPTGSGSPIPYVDTSGANNSNLRITNADAKALGLTPTPQILMGCSSNCDGFIEFNNTFTFDYNRSDGISGGAFDFIGLAIHEIGHALGFISGVDILDTNSTSPNFFPADAFTDVTPLDMFRCTPASAAAVTVLDFTAGPATKSFSLNNCATIKGTFSTGVVHGDGRQASHWTDNQGLGVMDPTANPGELLTVTPLDLTAFDVIGWNLAVPEPGALVNCVTWISGLIVLRRRRTPSITTALA